jgi:hypothetical protein
VKERARLKGARAAPWAVEETDACFIIRHANRNERPPGCNPPWTLIRKGRKLFRNNFERKK